MTGARSVMLDAFHREAVHDDGRAVGATGEHGGYGTVHFEMPLRAAAAETGRRAAAVTR